MLFQLHALLPLKAAAMIFQFVNLALLPIAVWLTGDIVRMLWPDVDPRRRRWTLVLAVLLAGQFLLNNLNSLRSTSSSSCSACWGFGPICGAGLACRRRPDGGDGDQGGAGLSRGVARDPRPAAPGSP